MAEIKQREVHNTNDVQHAELRIPIGLTGLTFQEIAHAVATVDKIRKLSLDHLDVDDSNADATGLNYKLDGETLVVDVVQVAY